MATQLEYIHDDPLHRRVWCDTCGCEVEVKKWYHPVGMTEDYDFICGKCGRICQPKEDGDEGAGNR